jgi:hypothetical protein
LSNTGQPNDEAGEFSVGINEDAERVNLLATFELDGTYLDDVVGLCANACRFEVESYECVFVNTWQVVSFVACWGLVDIAKEQRGIDFIGILLG